MHTKHLSGFNFCRIGGNFIVGIYHRFIFLQNRSIQIRVRNINILRLVSMCNFSSVTQSLYLVYPYSMVALVTFGQKDYIFVDHLKVHS